MDQNINKIVQVYTDLFRSIENNDDSNFISLINELCDLTGYKYDKHLYYENTSSKKDKIDISGEVLTNIVKFADDKTKFIIAAAGVYNNQPDGYLYTLCKIKSLDGFIEPLYLLDNEQKYTYLTEISKQRTSVSNKENLELLDNELEKIKKEISEDRLKKEEMLKLKEEEEKKQLELADDNELLNKLETTSFNMIDLRNVIRNIRSIASKEEALRKYILKPFNYAYDNDITYAIMQTSFIIEELDKELQVLAISLTFENKEFEEWCLKKDIENPKLDIKLYFDNWKRNAYTKVKDKKFLLSYYYQNNDFENIRQLQHSSSFDDELSNYLLELMGYSNKQKDYLNQLIAIDASNIKIDYRFLADKYIDNLHPYEMYLIHIAGANLLNISENRLDALKFGLRCYNKDDNDFTELFGKFFDGIRYCNELLDNIEITKLNDEMKKNLLTVIRCYNVMNVTNLEELTNLDESFKKAATLSADDGDTDVLKDKICLKKYGMKYKVAIELRNIYMSNPDIQKYFEGLNEIIDIINDYEAKRKLCAIYDRIDYYHEPVDLYEFEKKLKLSYEATFDNKLAKVSNMKLISNKDGTPIYDAGDDFKILVSAKAAFFHEETPDNFKDDWNRNNPGSSAFCASLISDEMLGMCSSIDGIYYGFDAIIDGSLAKMGPHDIESYSNQFGVGAVRGSTSFYDMDTLIDKTGYPNIRRTDLYNEIDIKRIMNGKKTQPSYLLVFKVNEKVINLSNALKASKDFDNLPIVVIDIDRQIAKGKVEINELINNYNNNPTKDNLLKLWDKFHKYSVTYSRWVDEKFYTLFNLPPIIADNLEIKNLCYDLKEGTLEKYIEPTITKDIEVKSL